ncbi:MAG: helix-turn-helix transcriptional regulator [Ruminococcus sp.]|nr:helix-turn-helix transcriptional regulator [Ruminococcus sp.]
MLNTQITAERIKIQAKQKGISVKKLLENCDLGVNTVTKMANGTDVVSQNLLKIANCLDCSVDYLLGRTDNPELSRESYYINGDNNGIQSNKGTVKVENSRKTDITEEFIQAFETLELSDKVDVMSFTMQKMKKEN